MKNDNVKYFQIIVDIEEKCVLDRFKIFLNNANLSYVHTYNPIMQSWKVFIDVEGEYMKNVVNSLIKTFIENERCARGDELYERSW